jgi:hypothetical protein
MAKEIVVTLEDRPGTLAHFGEVMGRSGVNIEAILVATRGGGSSGGTVQFLASDTDAAILALRADGVPCAARDVVVVDVSNEPGSLGDVSLVMADAGINIDSVYTTVDGKVVLGVDDYNGAMQVARGMAVL